MHFRQNEFERKQSEVHERVWTEEREEENDIIIISIIKETTLKMNCIHVYDFQRINIKKFKVTTVILQKCNGFGGKGRWGGRWEEWREGKL